MILSDRNILLALAVLGFGYVVILFARRFKRWQETASIKTRPSQAIGASERAERLEDWQLRFVIGSLTSIGAIWLSAVSGVKWLFISFILIFVGCCIGYLVASVLKGFFIGHDTFTDRKW